MARKKVSKEQETLVVSLVAHLHDQHYSDIRAVSIGYEKPDEIGWNTTEKGYMPDAVALKDQEYIFAVETDNSIADSATEDKWRVFSAYAQGQSKKFVVVVSGESEEKARQRVRDLGIKVEGVWAVA